MAETAAAAAKAATAVSGSSYYCSAAAAAAATASANPRNTDGLCASPDSEGGNPYRISSLVSYNYFILALVVITFFVSSFLYFFFTDFGTVTFGLEAIFKNAPLPMEVTFVPLKLIFFSFLQL